MLAATGGKLDALFNNGGYGQPGALEDITREVLRAQFEANVFGWHDLTRRLIPAMRAQKAGRIVFCSSILGMMAAPYRGAYCASKFAIEALADTLRVELERHRHQGRSLIEPGPIATRFVERAIEAYRRNVDLEASHASGDLPRPHRRHGAGGKQTFKLAPRRSPPSWSRRLKSKRPKSRYYVTVPTYAVAFAPASCRPRPRRDRQAELDCSGSDLPSAFAPEALTQRGLAAVPERTAMHALTAYAIPVALAAVARCCSPACGT